MPLIAFYVLFLSVCMIVYVAGLFYPWLGVVLAASSSTPWGVVTSLFIHGDVVRLASNLVGLLSFVLVFIFTNFFLPAGERVWRVTFFTLAILSATILSNLIWIFVGSLGSIGASGLIYASEGAVTGFCLLNFWRVYSEPRGTCNARSVLFVNLLVFILICVWMVFYSNSFISYGRDVNVLVHGSSFMLALILAIESGNLRGALGMSST